MLQGYIGLRNVGSTMVCTGAPSVELDFVELIGTVYGDPYYERYSRGMVGTVANDCIVPGGVGVLDVVTRSITLGALASAVSMSIDIFVYNTTYSVAVRDGSVVGDVLHLSELPQLDHPMTRGSTRVALVLSLLSLVACGDERRHITEPFPDGDVLMFDASMIGADTGPPRDLGLRDAGTDGPRVARDTCSVSADCNDDIACTTDVCTPEGTCSRTKVDAMCGAGQTCVATTAGSGCGSGARCGGSLGLPLRAAHSRSRE